MYSLFPNLWSTTGIANNFVQDWFNLDVEKFRPISCVYFDTIKSSVISSTLSTFYSCCDSDHPLIYLICSSIFKRFAFTTIEIVFFVPVSPRGTIIIECQLLTIIITIFCLDFEYFSLFAIQTLASDLNSVKASSIMYIRFIVCNHTINVLILRTPNSWGPYTPFCWIIV